MTTSKMPAFSAIHRKNELRQIRKECERKPSFKNSLEKTST